MNVNVSIFSFCLCVEDDVSWRVIKAQKFKFTAILYKSSGGVKLYPDEGSQSETQPLIGWMSQEHSLIGGHIHYVLHCLTQCFFCFHTISWILEAFQRQPFLTCPDEGLNGRNMEACFYWYNSHEIGFLKMNLLPECLRFFSNKVRYSQTTKWCWCMFGGAS